MLSREDVAQCLDLVALRDQLTKAFIAFSAGGTSVPPRMAAVTPDGLARSDAGVRARCRVRAEGGHGVRRQPRHGHPVASRTHRTVRSVQRLAHRGDGRVADHRGAHGTVGGDRCRPRRTSRCNVRCGHRRGSVGSRTHASAAGHSASGRTFASRLALAPTPRRSLRSTPAAVSVATFEEAVRGADVVCLCTDAAGSVIEHSWLAPGVHVSSVGRGAEVPDGDDCCSHDRRSSDRRVARRSIECAARGRARTAGSRSGSDGRAGRDPQRPRRRPQERRRRSPSTNPPATPWKTWPPPKSSSTQPERKASAPHPHLRPRASAVRCGSTADERRLGTGHSQVGGEMR